MGAKKRTKRAAEAAIARIEAHCELALAEVTARVRELDAFMARAREQLGTTLAETTARADTVEHRVHDLDAARVAVTTAASEFHAQARQQTGQLDRHRASVVAHLDEQCDAATAQLRTQLDAALTHFDDVIAGHVEQVELCIREAAMRLDDAAPAPASDDEPVVVDEPVVIEPAGHEVPTPAAPTVEPVAEEPMVATATLVAPRAPVSAVSMQVDVALATASLTHLARTASDGRVQIELVHASAQGQPTTYLRLVNRDVSGWWEQHDVQCDVPSFARRVATFDVGELLHALEYATADHGRVTLEFGDDITVGVTLVRATHVPLQTLEGQRRKVERVDLRRADRDGLVLDSQVGRLVVAPRLVSLLRSRRAQEGDLVIVGDQPCVVAQVAGPSAEVSATITAPLAAEVLDDVAPDRRLPGESPVSQLLAALSTQTTPDELVAILRHGVGYARRRAAAHPALPEGLIDAVLRDGTDAMRCAAASNPSIAVAAIERAAADPAPTVRAAVAANRNVPPVDLLRLARDDDRQVRQRVVQNPNVSPELLAVLAADPDPSVRAAVAAHEHCPEDALSTLAQDPYPEVCAAVAKNAACPVALLDELLPVAPEVVLAHHRVPEHLLVAGSQVQSRAIRVAVATNPSTPARQLQLLVRDPDPVVAAAVAGNPSASTSTRRRAQRAVSRLARARDGDGSTEKT